MPRWFWGLVIVLNIVVDQATKWIAIEHIRGRPRRIFLSDVFRLDYAENSGAFLSLGASLSDSTRFWLLTVAVGGILLVCFWALFRRAGVPALQGWGLSLIAGGGVSNLIDRAFRPGGRVIDFMNLGVGNLRTGIFNIADVAIMAGLFLLLFFDLRRAQRERAVQRD